MSYKCTADKALIPVTRWKVLERNSHSEVRTLKPDETANC